MPFLFPFFLSLNFKDRERERSRLFQIVFGLGGLFGEGSTPSPPSSRRTILTPSNALCQFKVRRGMETGRREEEITNATRRGREKGDDRTAKRVEQKRERERETTEKRNGFFWRPSPTEAREGSVFRAPILLSPSPSFPPRRVVAWLSSLSLTLGIIIQ